MLKNLKILVRSAELTPRRNSILQRRNSALTKKFGAERRVPLRRLHGGGQSARSSLNVIDWRHTIEYSSLKLASILCYFAKTMIDGK